MGLVMLLVPLLWVSGFSSAGGARGWLMLLVAVVGGALLGAVHGAYLDRTGRLRRPLLLGAVFTWFLIAALPGAAGQPDVLVAGATLALGVAWLRSVATARARQRDGAQRVELPTLRMVLPLFAVFVTLSALWPLDAIGNSWHGGFGLAPARSDLSRTLLMQALEYLATFTLVGFITAELYGRDNLSYRADVPRVGRRILVLVVLLEGARGWNSAMGASVILGLLAIGAGLFGGWLYHLQRDHVRTLLARPDGARA
jgi:hypothetical protein